MIRHEQKQDALAPALRVLSHLSKAYRNERTQRRSAGAALIGFGGLFLSVVSLETFFAAMMFTILEIEIMGHTVSGALFALLVPVVIGAAHVQRHHDRDLLTRFWLNRLSSIGILLFALGLSLMVGFSAWQASQAALADFSTGPAGMIGGQSLVTTPPDAGVNLMDQIAPIPNAALFLGLSFGMIISIYFASFCLGQVLGASSLLRKPPRIAKEAKTKIAEIQNAIAGFRKLQGEEAVAHRKLPLDLKHKFAREAGHSCWSIVQGKLTAARRKFDPLRASDPLAYAVRDVEIDALPGHFTTEEDFTRHMADQMDAMRMHHVLRILNNNSGNGEQQ